MLYIRTWDTIIFGIQLINKLIIKENCEAQKISWICGGNKIAIKNFKILSYAA